MSSIATISSLSPLPAYPHGAERERFGSVPSEPDLSDTEKKEVADLKKQDADVRQHEQAHLAAAGSYGKGSPAYEYKQGPDGKQYAVGGHVDIDTEEVKGDPEATLRKARVIQRAALAPREPSAQDRKVAREAEQMAQKAERDLREQKADVQGYDRSGTPVLHQAPAARIDVVA